jgi:hypothetical protein
MADFIIFTVITGAVALILGKKVKDAKAGKPGCGCSGCSGCGKKGQCH